MKIVETYGHLMIGKKSFDQFAKFRRKAMSMPDFVKKLWWYRDEILLVQMTCFEDFLRNPYCLSWISIWLFRLFSSIQLRVISMILLRIWRRAWVGNWRESIQTFMNNILFMGHLEMVFITGSISRIHFLWRLYVITYHWSDV